MRSVQVEKTLFTGTIRGLKCIVTLLIFVFKPSIREFDCNFHGNATDHQNEWYFCRLAMQTLDLHEASTCPGQSFSLMTIQWIRRYMTNLDVLFGEMVSGHSLPHPRMEKIAGCCVNMVSVGIGSVTGPSSTCFDLCKTSKFQCCLMNVLASKRCYKSARICHLRHIDTVHRTDTGR